MYEGFKNSKYAPCPLLVNMVVSGNKGLKTGEGFYKYSEGKLIEVSERFNNK
jgi:3-hydroxybutyryl-CoA dehydrogenase